MHRKTLVYTDRYTYTDRHTYTLRYTHTYTDTQADILIHTSLGVEWLRWFPRGVAGSSFDQGNLLMSSYKCSSPAGTRERHIALPLPL